MSPLVSVAVAGSVCDPHPPKVGRPRISVAAPDDERYSANGSPLSDVGQVRHADSRQPMTGASVKKGDSDPCPVDQ